MEGEYGHPAQPIPDITINCLCRRRKGIPPVPPGCTIGVAAWWAKSAGEVTMSQQEWIRTGRKDLGLSQGALGEKIDVSQVQVSQWETGKAEPSSEQAAKLAELFGNPAPKGKPAAKATVKQSKAKNGNGRTGAPKKQKSFEQTLWDTADRLRGSVESSEYKHVVLSLIFLKFISDKFEERRRELIAEGKEAYVDMVEFYTMKNVFYLPEESRWSFIQKNAKQDDIAVKIDTALHTVEKNNKSLRGALPDNYFSRLGIQVSKLAALIDSIDNIDTVADREEDVVGRVYEYFLGKFAATEGKGGGEFYTPKCVVNLIAEMIEPFRGKIYDPCCGSGGMFVQSVKFVESHQGNKKDVSIYGQELTATTYKLAKMNLAIRGIATNLGDVPADTFFRDQHPDLKADFIMANPPFNLDQWRGADELLDDPRWAGYDVPPTGNANYAWILHMISKLSENGVAGFVLANGSMSTNTRGEGAIRRKMIENDLVDCMIALPGQLFYTTQIPVCLWFVTKNKKAMAIEGYSDSNHRDRQGETLFIDARNMGTMIDRTHKELTAADIAEIARTYHAWRGEAKDGAYEDKPGFCKAATLEEIKANDYVLTPGRYVGAAEIEDDGVLFEEKMVELTRTLYCQMEESQKLDAVIRANLEALGYGE
jgi:type I restriction enzyme M protein